jgi:outer membrane receptor for ferrienterochelin and colicins
MKLVDCKRFPYWLVVILLLVSVNGFALGNNASVTVVRQDNNKPLPDVIIRIVTLSSLNDKKPQELIGFTDNTGKFNYSFTEPVIIQVSHLGYAGMLDTLYQLQDKTYILPIAEKDLKDVVITGQYSANSTQKSVYEVKVISQETLRNKGANNLREALQNELHIDLSQDAVYGGSLGINGISGEGVKILVDGVPIVGKQDGKLDLSQITINNIERIEIIEGPLSVLYGTDALGGVINIITKNFQRDKVNVSLRTYYETVGQYNIELNTGFTFKKSQIYLSGGRYFFDGYNSNDTVERFMEWKPKEQYFADAKYVLTGNRFRLSLTGSFFREYLLNRSAPEVALAYDNNDTAWVYKGDDQKFLTYRYRAAASFMYRFKEGYQLDVLAGYSGFSRFINQYYKNLVTGNEQLVKDANVQDTAFYNQFTGRATYTMPAWKNQLNFLFGVEINQEFTKQKRIENGSQSAGDYAAFGSIRYTPVEGFDIQPAVRFGYNTRFTAPLIPSLNVKYAYKNKLLIRASYGRGYRAPSLKELFLSFFNSDHIIVGNTELRPEDGHTVNFSISGIITKNKHTITITPKGFYNNIRNKIELFGAPPDTMQYNNVAKYITYGSDLSVNYTWDRLQFNVGGMVTGYRLNNTENVENVSKAFTVDANASASYRIPVADIIVYAAYKYNGVKPVFNVNSSISLGHRFAYHMLDISLSRNFWKDRIQLTVGGKNLAGVKNVTTQDVVAAHSSNNNQALVGWGRTFFVSLVLHFAK